ncbi:2,3-dehydroadipyl-CoA hydratase [compost metagenome]
MLCEDAEFDTAVQGHAQALLSMAPLAQAQIKRLMRQGQDCSQPAALSLEQEVLFRLYGTADGQEGIDAFLQKRPPVFQGR